MLRPMSAPERILSIIIPTRNQARTLDRLLRTLARLIPPPGWTTEIIAGYQSSRDNTLQVLNDHGIRVVNSTVIGAGPARNDAARVARGELFYFIDSDALPLGADFLIRLIETAGRLKRFGAFGGPVVLPDPDRWNPIAIADHFACWFNWPLHRPTKRTRLFQPALSLVVPRKVFEAVGGFDPAVRVMQDHEIQERMRRRRYPLYFVQSLPVAHAPRSSLWRTCRHSWYWGGPFRDIYLKNAPAYPLRYPVGSKLFPLNLPGLYLCRMRLVTKAAWRVSPWQTCFCFPFLAITVMAGMLGVIFGEGRPDQDAVTPV